MRVVLVGGGTGGHFYPLIAISEGLLAKGAEKRTFVELYYIGPDPYDKKSLDALGITFISCPAGKRRRYRSFRNFLDIFKTIGGLFVAFIKLLILYPDVVMSKGGYTSVPVTFAARLLRIPIVIHESDAVAGRANKLSAKAARYIAISYSEAAQFFPQEKTALTGIPIRKTLLSPAPEDAGTKLGLDTSLPTILVLGGSLGAERVNNLILESLDELLPQYNIVHQTGTTAFEPVQNAARALITDENLLSRYHPIAFMDSETFNLAYHTSSIVVSRSGSTTIFENAIHCKPSILIPIPEEISHDQRSNAYAYARTGAAVVMEESNLRDGLLVAEITRIMSDQAVYQEMSTAAQAFAPRDAAEKVADILMSIGNEHET